MAGIIDHFFMLLATLVPCVGTCVLGVAGWKEVRKGQESSKRIISVLGILAVVVILVGYGLIRWRVAAVSETRLGNAMAGKIRECYGYACETLSGSIKDDDLLSHVGEVEASLVEQTLKSHLKDAEKLARYSAHASWMQDYVGDNDELRSVEKDVQESVRSIAESIKAFLRDPDLANNLRRRQLYDDLIHKIGREKTAFAGSSHVASANREVTERRSSEVQIHPSELGLTLSSELDALESAVNRLEDSQASHPAFDVCLASRQLAFAVIDLRNCCGPESIGIDQFLRIESIYQKLLKSNGFVRWNNASESMSRAEIEKHLDKIGIDLKIPRPEEDKRAIRRPGSDGVGEDFTSIDPAQEMTDPPRIAESLQRFPHVGVTPAEAY